jgi:ATP-binding cassette subfamily B protein
VTATATEKTTDTPKPRSTVDSVLPELRTMWWETGLQARVKSGLLAVVQQLPRLIATAVRISWRADRTRTLIVGAATISAGVMATFGLLATQRILVELFEGGPTPQRLSAALPALAALAVITAVRGGLGITTGYAQNGLTPRVNREVERRLFEVTTAVRLDAFDEDAFADDMERASTGADSAIDLVHNAMHLVAGVVGLLAVTVAVIVIHPLLLLALLVATLPQAWGSLRAGSQRYEVYLTGSVRRRRLWILRGLMAERPSATELRSYGLRDFLLDQYDRVMSVELRTQLALARRMTTVTTVGSVVGGLATAAVYGLLGILLLNGQIPLAAAATCVVAIQAAMNSLHTVTYQVDALYLEGQHFGDYTGFMARASRHLPDAIGTATPGPLRDLAVRGVSLTYPDREAPAVDNLTLTIHSGQTVAFVGENGSGKSTLAAIIAGLRAQSHGEITWNGTPVAEFAAAELRRRIAVVTQDFHKWPFTAATNIAIGDADAEPDRDRIESAAGLAAAHETILALPHGYETLLDRTFAQGQDLSGGQWQRITAARGFLRDAELLIMDEPSSALDPRAEDALFQAIRDRQGRATTILITHRLANVRHADVIYVLHEGRLVESGRHHELVEAGGRYAELFTLQAAGYQF